MDSAVKLGAAAHEQPGGLPLRLGPGQNCRPEPACDGLQKAGGCG
eukprot:SAG31_NODE_46985_length_252_cov_0.673203_1_plen_44_part_01